MLRRRRKTPKPPKSGTTGAPASAPLSRRRQRPGTHVPAELRVGRQAGKTAAEAPAPGSEGEVVLVTGFEAFGGEALNPSWEICRKLPREIDGLRVETVRVPCEFRRAIEVAAEAIERYRPALVVCIGQAGGRAQMSVERVAVNVDDARIPDNAGAQPIDEPIAVNGPPAYLATLPIKAMVEAMRAAHVPADVSNTAGTYVCNHLMYGVLHFIAASGKKARAGFIHVPYAEEQVLDKPAMAALSIDTMAKGVEAAIAAAHRHAQDVKISGGTVA